MSFGAIRAQYIRLVMVERDRHGLRAVRSKGDCSCGPNGTSITNEERQIVGAEIHDSTKCVLELDRAGVTARSALSAGGQLVGDGQCGGGRVQFEDDHGVARGIVRAGYDER